METFKIKAFITAVKYKSFSRAAEDFSYTPSAFSHMAHSLNEELGVIIFKRTPTGIELTEEGEILYEKFLAIADAEDDLFATARKLSESKMLELRIGTYSSISRFILPEIIKNFKKEHPEIKVSVTVSAKLHGWCEKDMADIVFCDNMAMDKENWFPIMEDPFVAVVPEGTFPACESIEFEKLYDYPYIAVRDQIITNYIDISRFKEIIPFVGEDDDAVISMVKEGIGVAIVSALTCGNASSGVNILSLEPNLSRTLGIGYKKTPSPSAAKFIEFIKTNYVN